MTTLLIRNTRVDLLRILPKGATVAEIGVARADFSLEMLKEMEPAKLYLIDPWEEQSKADYQTDPSNIKQSEFDRRFEFVRERLQEPINKGTVELRRAYSTTCAPEFPYGFFDFVYIDGDHTYSAVLNDLRLFYPRTKDTGFIAGHDFANHLLASYANFGVIEAVCDFIRETGAELIMITGGTFPTYVIAHPNSQAANHLKARAVLELAPVALIDDLHELRFATEIVGVDRKGNQILLPKIAPR